METGCKPTHRVHQVLYSEGGGLRGLGSYGDYIVSGQLLEACYRYNQYVYYYLVISMFVGDACGRSIDESVRSGASQTG